jgi:hypothetical protein
MMLDDRAPEPVVERGRPRNVTIREPEPDYGPDLGGSDRFMRRYGGILENGWNLKYVDLDLGVYYLYAPYNV